MDPAVEGADKLCAAERRAGDALPTDLAGFVRVGLGGFLRNGGHGRRNGHDRPAAAGETVGGIGRFGRQGPARGGSREAVARFFVIRPAGLQWDGLERKGGAFDRGGGVLAVATDIRGILACRHRFQGDARVKRVLLGGVHVAGRTIDGHHRLVVGRTLAGERLVAIEARERAVRRLRGDFRVDEELHGGAGFLQRVRRVAVAAAARGGRVRGRVGAGVGGSAPDEVGGEAQEEPTASVSRPEAIGRIRQRESFLKSERSCSFEEARRKRPLALRIRWPTLDTE